MGQKTLFHSVLCDCGGPNLGPTHHHPSCSLQIQAKKAGSGLKAASGGGQHLSSFIRDHFHIDPQAGFQHLQPVPSAENPPLMLMEAPWLSLDAQLERGLGTPTRKPDLFPCKRQDFKINLACRACSSSPLPLLWKKAPAPLQVLWGVNIECGVVSREMLFLHPTHSAALGFGKGNPQGRTEPGVLQRITHRQCFRTGEKKNHATISLHGN